MKKIILPLLTIIALFCVTCADKFDHNGNTEDNRYFIIRNTTPYYFYDSTGNPIINYVDKEIQHSDFSTRFHLPAVPTVFLRKNSYGK